MGRVEPLERDVVPDGEQVPGGVVEEPEVHRVGEPTGPAGEVVESPSRARRPWTRRAAAARASAAASWPAAGMPLAQPASSARSAGRRSAQWRTPTGVLSSSRRQPAAATGRPLGGDGVERATSGRRLAATTDVASSPRATDCRSSDLRSSEPRTDAAAPPRPASSATASVQSRPAAASSAFGCEPVVPAEQVAPARPCRWRAQLVRLAALGNCSAARFERVEQPVAAAPGSGSARPRFSTSPFLQRPAGSRAGCRCPPSRRRPAAAGASVVVSYQLRKWPRYRSSWSNVSNVWPSRSVSAGRVR